MNTLSIRKHLLDCAPWVDRAQTVDRVLAGDATREIHHVAVGWMATLYNLQAAHDMLCDLFISHEPLYWNHRQSQEQHKHIGPGLVKQEFLASTGMAVLRAHDSWDNWPEIGIRDSWARGLGLDYFVAEDKTRWHAMYRIQETTLGDFARYVAQRVVGLGQDSVRVYGDLDSMVSYPSLGVGCGGPDRDMIDKGSDVLIVCDDGVSYWADIERFVEHGVGVIVVEHGTSEMWGVENLAKYVAETWPQLGVHYLDRHPRGWTVTVGS